MSAAEDRTVAIGVILGAWLVSRHGWRQVWVAALTLTILAGVDLIYGDRIGQELAGWTRELFQ